MIRLTDRDVFVTRTVDGKRVQTIETHPKPRPLMDVLAEHVAKVQAERDLEDQRDRDELARERDREWWAE